MDLVRDILLEIEAQPAGDLIRNSVLPEKWSEEELVGHLRLINHAGLVDGKMEFFPEATLIAIHGLSNEGHALLDSIRSEAVWKTTKERVEEVGGSVALDTLKAIAGAVMAMILGLPPSMMSAIGLIQ